MFDSNSQMESCLSFLHNIGFIIHNKITSKICTDPAFLAKAMACFAFCSQHDLMMFGKIEGNLCIIQVLTEMAALQSIISLKGMKERLFAVFKDSQLVSTAMECLEEFEFCFKLAKEENLLYEQNELESYMIPTLRPNGDFGVSPRKQLSNFNCI